MSRDCPLLKLLALRLAVAAVMVALFSSTGRAQIFDPPDPPGGNVDPIVVDPVAPGLAPIALPPFIDSPPTGTVPVPTPPTGELPGDLPDLSGSAEQRSVDFQTAFYNAHSGAPLSVSPVVGDASYAVTIDLNPAGDDFATYSVAEDLNHIAVSYTMHDGTRSRVLASHQLAGPLDGGFVHARFLADALTSLVITSQTGEEATTVQPPSLAGAGLSSPAALETLDDLVPTTSPVRPRRRRWRAFAAP